MVGRRDPLPKIAEYILSLLLVDEIVAEGKSEVQISYSTSCLLSEIEKMAKESLEGLQKNGLITIEPPTATVRLTKLGRIVARSALAPDIIKRASR